MTIETWTGKNWEECEHKSWKEIIDDGWVFCYPEPNGVMMMRKGYLNLFRNKQVSSYVAGVDCYPCKGNGSTPHGVECPFCEGTGIRKVTQ